MTPREEKAMGLTGSFAMIRLHDHTVVISLRQVVELGLEDFAVEVLAHEIGHHVYCPADLADNARLMARIRAGLPTKEHLAPFVANLYSDLLINDRLQRGAQLNMPGVYDRFVSSTDRLWTLYMRIYELLWRLPRGQHAKGAIDQRLNQDAQLGARLVRSYSKDWLDGAGRFAALCLPYLLDEAERLQRCLAPWLDTQAAGRGYIPDGLSAIDPYEVEGAIHPSEDPELSGVEADNEASHALPDDTRIGGWKTPKSFRSPVEYLDVLRAAGVDVDERQIVAKYYRERALPHLIRFPARTAPQATDPLLEGLEIWDIDSPVNEIDWLGTLINSAQVIPGLTTRRREFGHSPDGDPDQTPIDLYLGVDCSGSMGNPAHHLSYPILAGAIIAISAIRSGSKVQVALSGEPGRTVTTDGFIRQPQIILKTLTDYLGTGYAFGIHRLRDTFDHLPRGARPIHILIVSDNDTFAMLDSQADDGRRSSKETGDEISNDETGWQVAQRALQAARGGGTFVLELPEHVVSGTWSQPTQEYLDRIRSIGWNVAIVSSMDQLVEFARQFSQRYAEAIV
ncbi:MAG: hypothetical protein R3C53_00310 [Pirellulaceae bacterium]